MRAAVDKIHADQFLLRILDDSGAPKPNDPQSTIQVEGSRSHAGDGNLAALLSSAQWSITIVHLLHCTMEHYYSAFAPEALHLTR